MASPADRRSFRLARAAMLIALLLAGEARANLVATSGEGVEMIDMRIVLHTSGKVKAVYTFWNDTGKEVVTPVGFHVPAGGVEKFGVAVDGEKVEHREENGRYVFDVTFPPKQNVTVKAAYVQPPAGTSEDHTLLSLVLRTTGGWKGDIGNFNLYVTVPGHVCQPLAISGGSSSKGSETLAGRKGTIAPWKSGTAFKYSLKANEKGTKLNLWAQDFEPGGDITVLVPAGSGACTWDPALVTDPLEKTCRFTDVVKAKKKQIEKLAREMDVERIRACLGLPDYLLDGGAVFGKETYGGIETALIEKHHDPAGSNQIPLYMKSGLVPGLKTFEKKLKQILAQMP